MSTHAISLEDLATRFQPASGSLERSYRELQGRVQSLTAELGREREERIRLERLAAIGGMTMELSHESIERMPAPTRMSVDRLLEGIRASLQTAEQKHIGIANRLRPGLPRCCRS